MNNAPRRNRRLTGPNWNQRYGGRPYGVPIRGRPQPRPRPAVTNAQQKKLDAQAREVMKMGALGLGIGLGASLGAAYAGNLGNLPKAPIQRRRQQNAQAPQVAASPATDFSELLAQALGVNADTKADQSVAQHRPCRPVQRPRPVRRPRPVKIYGLLLSRKSKGAPKRKATKSAVRKSNRIATAKRAKRDGSRLSKSRSPSVKKQAKPGSTSVKVKKQAKSAAKPQVNVKAKTRDAKRKSVATAKPNA